MIQFNMQTATYYIQKKNKDNTLLFVLMYFCNLLANIIKYHNDCSTTQIKPLSDSETAGARYERADAGYKIADANEISKELVKINQESWNLSVDTSIEGTVIFMLRKTGSDNAYCFVYGKGNLNEFSYKPVTVNDSFINTNPQLVNEDTKNFIKDILYLRMTHMKDSFDGLEKEAIPKFYYEDLKFFSGVFRAS